LEFFRQASSETEGTVAKGSAGGHAITFRPRFAALVSSIRVGLIHEADRMRFNELELERSQDPEQFDEFKRLVDSITGTYASRFFARTFSLLPVLQANIDVLWNTLRTRYTARIGQQYGALLAGYWLLEHDTPISEEDSHRLINSLSLDEVKAQIQDKEESECLEYLLDKLVSVDHGATKSIGELLQGDNEDILARYGVRNDEKHIWIATKNTELLRIFKGTRWESGWGKSLARIAGSEKGSIRIGPKTVYGIRLLKDTIFVK
jgi:putative DNA primase/helicase